MSSLSIQITVRRLDGSPIPGLSTNDFSVKFAGFPANVLSVDALAGGHEVSTTPMIDQTYLLLMIPPMTAEGRYHVLADTLAHLQQAKTNHWSVGLLDPSANFWPFTTDISKVQANVQSVLYRIDKPEYGNEWPEAAHRSMRLLAGLPGRRVVIFAADPLFSTTASFKQNPNLIRVGPTLIEDDALRSMAQVYPLETSNPGLMIPFGGAAVDPSLTGGSTNEAVIGRIQLGEVQAASEAQSEAWAANGEVTNATGGREENSVVQSFRDIERDGAGTYRLAIGVDPAYFDGAFYTIKVSVDRRGTKVFAAKWLNTPLELSKNQPALLPALEKLLRTSDLHGEIPISLGAWYFPDTPGSLATMVFAAQLQTAKTVGHQTGNVEFAARVMNSADLHPLATWRDGLQGHANDNGSDAMWVHSYRLPPGTYLYRAAVQDPQSGKNANASFTFQVDAPSSNAFLGISSLLLSTDCLPVSTTSDARRNLFDPLQDGDCRLAPLIPPILRRSQEVHVLLHLYRGTAPSTFPKGWSAAIEIKDASGQVVSRRPSQIESGNWRGWTVSDMLSPGAAGLVPGEYEISVVLTGPHKRTFSAKDHIKIVD